MREMPQSKDYLFLPVLLGGVLLSELLLNFGMRAAGIAVFAVACVIVFFNGREHFPPLIRAGLSIAAFGLGCGAMLSNDKNSDLGLLLGLLGIASMLWLAFKIAQPNAFELKVAEEDAAENGEAFEMVAMPAEEEVSEEAAMDEVVVTSHQDEAKELATSPILKPGFSYSAITLPPDYPTPPTRWESQVAAVLLTHGKLKAFTHEMGFGENAESLVPLLSNRELAEAIIDRVPHIRMPVYEWVTPPLTDFPERELKDWERELEDWHMRPMPDYVPHLPARVTAFTSHPWGRVGLFLVVFDAPEMPVRWGMWYLRQPSAKTGTAMPFFRLGDFDDAELLAWLVLKPFLDAQAVMVENLNPPASETYLGPWHKMGKTLKFREVPDWFAKTLQQQ